MITKEQTDAHHVRSIRAALTLVERQRYSDALSLLEVNLGTRPEAISLPRELSRSLKAAGRQCVDSDHKHRRLGEYLYEAAIISAEPMEPSDVYLLVKWGNKNLALRACRLIDRNRITDRTISLAYVHHVLGGLRKLAIRMQASTDAGKTWTYKRERGRNYSTYELARFLYLWLYSATSENELLSGFDSSTEGRCPHHNTQIGGTESYGAASSTDLAPALDQYCKKSAIAWTAFARDVAEGTSENSRTTEFEIWDHEHKENASEYADSDRVALEMLKELFSLKNLEALKRSHHKLLSGKLEDSTSIARSVKGDVCDVSRVLGLTIETLSSGLLGNGQLKLEQLQSTMKNVKGVAGIASMLTLALHAALIVRLLAAGLLERALAELDILSFSDSLSSLRMGPAIGYLTEVARLSRPDHASMDSRAQLREDMLQEIISNNLYSNLLMILREPDKEGLESIYGNGLVKPVEALMNLQRLRIENRFAEYVEYAGSVTDELLAEEYQDYEFVFDIRVNQAEVLENLGRTRHAERVAAYVLTNCERMQLSNRIQTRARVVLGRSLLAEGDLLRASEILSDGRPNYELTAAELYVRGLVNEKSGKLVEAINDLVEVTARPLSANEISLLKLEEGQIGRKIEILERCVELNRQAGREV